MIRKVFATRRGIALVVVGWAAFVVGQLVEVPMMRVVLLAAARVLP